MLQTKIHNLTQVSSLRPFPALVISFVIRIRTITAYSTITRITLISETVSDGSGKSTSSWCTLAKKVFLKVIHS